MDLHNQQRVKDVVAQYGAEDIVIILGTSSTTDAANFAETVTDGDQSYTGPLAGVSLKLPVYHMMEPQIRSLINPVEWVKYIFRLEERLASTLLSEAVRCKRALYGREIFTDTSARPAKLVSSSAA